MGEKKKVNPFAVEVSVSLSMKTNYWQVQMYFCSDHKSICKFAVVFVGIGFEKRDHFFFNIRQFVSKFSTCVRHIVLICWY